MNPLILGPLFELGKGIIDRLFPDPAKKAQAELELLKMAQDGDLKTILAQLEINAREAQHPSIFVAGWRPFIGWVCGAAIAYRTVVYDWLLWVQLTFFPQAAPLPKPEIDEVMWELVFGLLGIAGLRSIEKVKGRAK